MAALRSALSLARPCLLRSVGIRLMADAAPASAAANITLTFGSPGEAFYNGTEVTTVHVKTMDGHVGILPEHVPLLAAMVPHVAIVETLDGKEDQYFISSGGLTVNGDSSVQILAEEAVPIDQLDPQAIRAGFEAARTQLSAARTDKEVAEAEINFEAWEALSESV